MAGSIYTLRPWTFNASDISFLYQQVTFIPLFDASGNPIINWDGTTNAYLSNGTLIVGTTAVDANGNNLNVNQYGVSYVSTTDIAGTRVLSGLDNNLTAGQTHWGQVLLPFPRMTPADFTSYLKVADPTTGIGGPLASDLSATATVQAVDPTYMTALTNTNGTPITTTGTGAFSLTGALNANGTYTAVAASSSAFDVAAAAQANSSTYIATGAFYAKQFAGTNIVFNTDYLTTGSGGYSSNGSQGQATTTPLVVNQQSVVDYTERMISLDTTTAGVTFLKDANNKIVFNEGIATVTDYGQLKTVAQGGLGQIDYQNPNGNTVVVNHGLTVYNHVLQGGVWVATTQPFYITNTQAALHYSDGSVVIDPVTHNPIVVDGSNLLSVNPTTGAVTPTSFSAGAAAHFSNGSAITDPTVMGPTGPVNPPPAITLNPIAAHPDQFIGAINPGVAPSSGYVALFGQFFDHGLDFVAKGAQQTTVTIALAPTDPLYVAPGNPNDGFGGMGVTSMTINRANVSGFDTSGVTAGDPNYLDNSSPYIDQSQTYGSDSSKINLLREWVSTDGGKSFHAGADLFDGHTGATWTNGLGQVTNSTLPTIAELRAHLVATGRDDLTWDDISGIRNRDASGHVIAAGQAGAGTGDSLILDMNPHFDATHFATWTAKPPVVANLAGAAAGVATATNIIAAINAQAVAEGLPIAAGGNYNLSSPFGTISMGNIMIGAGPGMASLSDFIDFATFQPKAGLSTQMTTLVKELLLESISDHYVAGDGRANENMGLTAVHHVFHEEHNYQVATIEKQIQDQDTQAVINGDLTHDTLHKWQIQTAFTDANGNYLVSAGGDINWDPDKIFNAAKITVEMEYQHIAVDQYSRTITPDLPEFVGYNSSVNANVTNEFAQVAFRFGHSTLRETIDTMDPSGGLTGKIMSYALKDAFVNPALYSQIGAASITLGMSHQQMNEVDEFLTPAMNQGLLGQPLDLAAINIARGRDMGMPTLNEMKTALGFQAYTNWIDFGSHMQHSTNLAGFIAAYSMDGDIDRANALVNVYNGGTDSVYGYTYQSAFDFLTNNTDVNKVDAWIGGMAEQHVLSGLLGETFNAIFLNQVESLMDGDRFYYLYRMSGLQMNEQMVNEQFKDVIERNTGLTHLNGNIFAYADAYYDESQKASASDIVTQGREHKYADVMSTYETAAAVDSTNTQKHVGIYSVGSSSTGGVSAELVNGQIKTMSTVIYNEGTQNVTHSDINNVTNGSVMATITEKYVYDVRPDVAHGQMELDGVTPVSGSNSNEVLVGTNYDDVIFLGGGDDTAYGDGGNDIIYGDGGQDRIYGGEGNDTLYGGEGPDIIDGGNGDDLIFGGASGTGMNGVDQLIGGNGNDTIYGGTGIDKISGEAGDDVIYGGGDTDPFTHGGDGNDYIDGGTGGDLLFGDAGDDVIVGGADQDVLYGGSGDDILRPGAASQALIGAGVDEVVGGMGLTTETAADYGFNIMDLSDWAAGAPGVVADFATQGAPATTIKGTATDFPAWFQIQGIVATANNDTIIGDDTGNWIIGGSGNDTVTGGAGSDIIVGNHIRLDSLIGNYLTKDPVTGLWSQAAYNYTAFDTGSHRAGNGVYGQGGVAATLATSGDLIDAANAALGTQTFDKHFTNMLQSAMFKDMVLGDDMNNSTGSGVGLDTAVYSGNFADYAFKTIIVNTANEGAILGTLISDKVVNGVDEVVANGGSATTTDLVIGMTYLQFKDVKINVTNLAAPIFTNVTPSQSVDENSTSVIETFNVTSFTGNPFTVKLGNTADDAYFSIVDNLNGTFSLVANGTGLNYENLTHYGIPYNLDIIATDSVNGFLNSTNIAVTALNVDEASTGNIALTGGYTSGDTAVTTVSQVTVNALNTLLDPDLVRPGTALTTSGKVVDQTLSTVNPQQPNTANPYQWQSSTNLGTTWTNVANQNAAALTVNSSNTVTEYRVVSSYADVFGVHNATTDPLTAISGVAVIGTSNTAGDNLTGTANDDLILALNGNDTINGYTGADTVDGGAGVDTLLINDATNAAAISVALDTNVLNVEVVTAAAATAGVTLDLHLQTERFTSINGSAFADVITGPTSINNGIYAGAGNDTVVGFATGNTVDGGTGTDSIQINSTADATAISAASNAAVNLVEVITAANAVNGVALNLSAQSEALSIVGSNFDDTVVGFVANDTVDGGTGLDTIQINTTGSSTAISGATDTALTNVEVITAAGVTGVAGVTLNLSSQTESFTSIIGSNNADIITTSATVANAIYAGAGNDTLVGFATGNTVDGGTGSDTIQINSAAVATAFSAATDAAVTNVEVISAATSAAGVTLNVSAQTEALSIIGSNSNDTIVGYAAGNSVDGGTGSDRILINTAADATAISAASNAALANVEIITAAGSNAAVTLNLANQTEALSIIGSNFDDTFGYATGNTIDGGTGIDTIQVNSAANATAISGASNAALANIEIISAASSNAAVTLNLANQSEALSIIGSAFADAITGGTGNDTIVGYTTGDSVTGGTGTDTLQINSTADAAAFSLATDAALATVEVISAAAATVGVTLNVAAQTEALSIIGSGFADTIVGYATGNSVDGGAGSDTIQINTAAAATAISAASNAALANVEIISAAGSNAAVTLNLANQTEVLSIIGSTFADTFVGYATGNSVDGGAGSDTIQINSAANAAAISAASDAALVNVEVISAAASNAGVSLNLAAQTEALSVIGSNLADTIIGFATGESVNGGVGTDTIQINTAANATAISAALDIAVTNVEVITAAAATVGVTLDLSAQTEALSIVGSAFADTIVGYATGNSVDGGAGIDTIQINNAAAATAISGASNTALANVEVISAAAATAGVTLNLAAQTEALSIIGSAFADTFVGYTAGNSVDGGAGADTIQINSAANATAISAATDAALVNVEVITAAAANAAVTLNLAAQTEALSIIGSGFADTFVGYVTGNSIDGGAGSDTIQINTVAAANAVSAASNAAIANVEVITAAGSNAAVTLNLSNQTEALSIVGSTFNDTIVGFVTNDSVDGGAGTDTIQINSAANATAISAASNTALANVEIITAAGSNAAVTLNLANQTEALSIIGSALADAITGGTGNDTISGFTTGDSVTGGTGTDTIQINTAADAAAVSAASNAAIATVEVITAAAATLGLTLNLSAQTEALTIIGSGFADTIVGFVTGDSVDGGAGIDTLRINTAANATAISAASNAALANVEIITAAGSNAAVTLNFVNQTEALSIIGSALADAITGGTGNDTISGFTTGDSVTGGTGTDTIQINTAADATAIAAASNAAIATVEVISAAAATLGLTLNLSTQTEALSIIGSGFADTIVGFVTGDSVDGGAGVDTIQINSAANATAISAASNAALANVEVINASAANAAVTLNMAVQTEALTIIGSANNDTITASIGGDSIKGGAGNDVLTGGAGIDTFGFETTAALNGLDTINTFAKANDILQVSSFFTATPFNTTNVFSNGTTTANVAATAYDHHVVLINSAADLATTAGFNSIFGAGAGHLALFTTNAQQAVLIEGLAGAGNDKMYYITHDAAGTHATQVATLVGVGQFAAAGDIHVA